MWAKVTTPEERRELKASLVYQEICSYIKGSAEAISGDTPSLTLDQYLEVCGVSPFLSSFLVHSSSSSGMHQSSCACHAVLESRC